jgi:hypothetical protein
MIEKIENNGTMLALILRANFSAPGIHFFTPNEFSQQLGYMRHPSGKVILPHYHQLKQRALRNRVWCRQRRLYFGRGRRLCDRDRFF